jgi:CBS domain-containing protein
MTLVPETTLDEALKLMAQHGYSQMPVVVGREVLGVFSYRSFAGKALEHEGVKGGLGALPVEAFTERSRLVDPREELPELFDLLDKKDYVLVGDVAYGLLGVVTTVDVLRWLHDLAEPFVRIGEIERALRQIVGGRLDGETIAGCAIAALSSKYSSAPDKLPKKLDLMTFEELRLVVLYRRNWELIEPALGRNLGLATQRLKGLPDLRNDVFHFRRDLLAEEMLRINETRDWLLGRLNTLLAETEGA